MNSQTLETVIKILTFEDTFALKKLDRPTGPTPQLLDDTEEKVKIWLTEGDVNVVRPISVFLP